MPLAQLLFSKTRIMKKRIILPSGNGLSLTGGPEVGRSRLISSGYSVGHTRVSSSVFQNDPRSCKVAESRNCGRSYFEGSFSQVVERTCQWQTTDNPSDLYIPDTFNTSTDINGKKYALYCNHPTGYFKCSDILRNSTKIMVG